MGPVAAGKTTVAEGLAERLDAVLVKTRTVLEQGFHYRIYPPVSKRELLQSLGEQLDEDTNGRWVADAAEHAARFVSPRRPIIIDAIRRESQIAGLEERFGAAPLRLFVTAPEDELRRRYELRIQASPQDERPTYDELKQSAAEAEIYVLQPAADTVIDTGIMGRRQAPLWAAFAVKRRRALAHGSGLARFLWLGGRLAVVVLTGVVVLPVLIMSLVLEPMRVPLVLVAFGLAAAALIGSALSVGSPADMRRPRAPLSSRPIAPAEDVLPPSESAP